MNILFFSFNSFAQEKKENLNKKVDQNVTKKMDSLSKLYKLKVVGAYEITHNDVHVVGFVYEDKKSGKLIERETKRIKL